MKNMDKIRTSTVNAYKINVRGRGFYWYVAVDKNAPDATCMLALNIISEDQQFRVRYHLNQTDPATRHITVLGAEFGGKKNLRPGPKRYLSPEWITGSSVTNQSLVSLISWCMLEKEELFELDENGNRLSDGSYKEKMFHMYKFVKSHLNGKPINDVTVESQAADPDTSHRGVNPVVKKNWMEIQKNYNVPVNAIGIRIKDSDIRTLQAWKDQGIDNFIKK